MANVKSPDDRVVIHNIDVDCDDQTIEYYKKIGYGLDDEEKKVATEEDIPYEFNHSEGFQVMYGGNIFSIRPGETRAFPRYIGEHYAKHLIDHLLQKKAEKLNKQTIVNDPKERQALFDQIIISEELLLQDYTPQDTNMETSDAGSKLLREEEIEVTDPVIGNVQVKEPETVTLEDIKNAPDDDTVEVGENVKTRAELMAECKVMGIPIQRTDKARDLLAKLKAF